MGILHLLLAEEIPDIKTGLLNTMSYIFMGVAAMQSILALVLLFRFGTAYDANHRARVRKWLLNVCSSLIIILALIGLFQAMVFNYGGVKKKDEMEESDYTNEVDETIHIDGKDIQGPPAGISLKYGTTLNVYSRANGGGNANPFEVGVYLAQDEYEGALMLKLESTGDIDLSKCSLIKFEQDGGGNGNGNVTNHYALENVEGDWVMHSSNAKKGVDTQKYIICNLRMPDMSVKKFAFTITFSFQDKAPPYNNRLTWKAQYD